MHQGKKHFDWLIWWDWKALIVQSWCVFFLFLVGKPRVIALPTATMSKGPYLKSVRKVVLSLNAPFAGTFAKLNKSTSSVLVLTSLPKVRKRVNKRWRLRWLNPLPVSYRTTTYTDLSNRWLCFGDSRESWWKVCLLWCPTWPPSGSSTGSTRRGGRASLTHVHDGPWKARLSSPTQWNTTATSIIFNGGHKLLLGCGDTDPWRITLRQRRFCQPWFHLPQIIQSTIPWRSTPSTEKEKCEETTAAALIRLLIFLPDL